MQSDAMRSARGDDEMINKRFVATCKCPVCGQRAKYVDVIIWDDSPYIRQWHCDQCQKTYRGDRFGIILKATGEKSR